MPLLPPNSAPSHSPRPLEVSKPFPISHDLRLPWILSANRCICNISPEKENWGEHNALPHTHAFNLYMHIVDKFYFPTVLSPAAHFVNVTLQIALILLFAFVLCDKRQVARGLLLQAGTLPKSAWSLSCCGFQ